MKKEIKDYVKSMKPLAKEKAIIKGDHFRITVLTSRLIRLEYSDRNAFVDAPTQMVCNREFDLPDFKVVESDNLLEIKTADLHVFYDRKKFSPQGLWISLESGYGVYGSTWNYGDQIRDLGGTARTLDNVDGAIELESGLMSRDGFAVVSDVHNAMLDENGWIVTRNQAYGKENKENDVDLYFFGYGHDYLGCLKDFYYLCGKTPLLSRYMLGNWWSRYYPYKQDEYIELMDRFKGEEIPLSVSVIDMDWHKVQIPAKYGSGWTGYSWNTMLFPDPNKFLSDLHERGLHTTLNLHPADGVKGHEDQYRPMAEALGVDYEAEEKIPFDVSSPEFMDAYFTYLHHPLEEDGVDFWWMDWQQGTVTRTEGLDALWMLNYLHFLDSGRDGKRPVTFSRYAGIGSHRFPIGFSGDTVSSWASLKFQPYFTANASNVGYTWWSHDIGGHQNGEKDDELVTRWIQLGVFSPIMRLHSTANPFYGKEPWNYDVESGQVMAEFMKLRHQLIPYLYSANYMTSEEGIPLVMPMYYKWDKPEAYEVKNQYLFGDAMIVSPIVEPANRKTRLASVRTWLPEGLYYDYFTGNAYKGNRDIINYRSREHMPVFVKAGGIIPLDKDVMTAHLSNPKNLLLKVYHGADGSFTMIEDECKEMDQPEAITKSLFTYECKDRNVFSLRVEECLGQNVIPEDRTYWMEFHGVVEPEKVIVKVDGLETEGDYIYDEEEATLFLTISGNQIQSFDVIFVPANEADQIKQCNITKQIYDLLNRAQVAYNFKAKVYEICTKDDTINNKLAALYALRMREDIDEDSFTSLFGAILELLTLL